MLTNNKLGYAAFQNCKHLALFQIQLSINPNLNSIANGKTYSNIQNGYIHAYIKRIALSFALYMFPSWTFSCACRIF